MTPTANRSATVNSAGKTVLITGGTGSFGKTMAKHLLDQGYEQVRIFSRDEWKQEEMRVRMAEPRLRFYIGDVRSRASVDSAMEGVDLVFHAAALKQVPSCEFFPMEAVATNIEGSNNVIESAIAARAECVVCLGTDKAVYPINAMGMTKALMEKVAQSAARRLDPGETRICSVRYGNVMYSRGSVIPLFINQIREGGPLTVTEAAMTRFMLPLRDSVRLVEFAFQNARQGDVFIKKAAACTIGDLIAALQKLFGTNVEVQSIGLRHGEKLHETLASLAEVHRAEDMGDFLRIPMDDRDLNYAKFFSEGEQVSQQLTDYDSESTEQLNVSEVCELLLSLPEVREQLDSWKSLTNVSSTTRDC
ncbi:UDP-glucose 4-epimerase [Planctomycetes bacterium CA13]|uniref:UDP-glucose 4-epimerase n=1 Tax=Novipirellula herctigrandis TaxID=2527986 RepID=A0A5C5Z2L0_9BACT|nr:UDP-glucose 4-epimerase [Planctomycetes bacterium CA13]